MGICEAIYNKETGAILTRTPASWGKIGLFYLVYYTCLACFFAGLLAIFLYAFTDDKAPLLTGEHSVLPPNPGMGFRPMPDETKTMIKYSISAKKEDKDGNIIREFDPFVKNLNDFLNPEKEPTSYMKGQGDAYQDCTGPLSDVTWATKPCKFDVAQNKEIMENCVNSNFGFEDGTPCFVVKMNKIFEFMPNLTDAGEVLKIQCQGEHPADKDNIGKLEYFPSAQDGKAGAIDMAYYPYVGQPGYLSPLVFVKMANPKRGVLIQIVCQPINAENIVQEKMKRGDGRVTLEVLIDN